MVATFQPDVCVSLGRCTGTPITIIIIIIMFPPKNARHHLYLLLRRKRAEKCVKHECAIAIAMKEHQHPDIIF